MQVTVQGKQIDVGDALRSHVIDKIEELNGKYFNHANFATVTFSKEGHGNPLIKSHISINVGKNIMVIADDQNNDPYNAFDSAADKVAKQMRRYKKKLRDHHQRKEQTPEEEILKARDYILASEASNSNDEAEESADEPLVIAEMTTDIETLTVSEAVMRMDLSGENAMMFRNQKSDGLNVIYRRSDGNIGWIDPEQDLKKSA